MANNPQRDLFGSSFFNTKYWKNGDSFMLNSILSTTLCLMDYFDKLLFVNDHTRVIYSSNAYAFRARLQSSRGNENSDIQANDLNFPFMNLAITQGGISLQDTKLNATYEAKTSGIYIEELGKKVRLFPMNIRFEGVYYTTQMADAQIAISRVFRKASSELLLAPVLWYNGIEIKNVANVVFDDVVLDDVYTESDWLEKNRIHTIGFSVSVSTYLVDIFPGAFTEEDDPSMGGSGSSSKYWNVRKVLLYWAERNNLASWNGNDFDDWATGIVDHLDQEVYWHQMPAPKIEIVGGKLSPPTIEVFTERVNYPDIEIRPVDRVATVEITIRRFDRAASLQTTYQDAASLREKEYVKVGTDDIHSNNL